MKYCRICGIELKEAWCNAYGKQFCFDCIDIRIVNGKKTVTFRNVVDCEIGQKLYNDWLINHRVPTSIQTFEDIQRISTQSSKWIEHVESCDICDGD